MIDVPSPLPTLPPKLDALLEVATKMAIYGFAIVTPLVIFVIMFILVSKFDLEKTLPAMKEEIAKRKAQNA